MKIPNNKEAHTDGQQKRPYVLVLSCENRNEQHDEKSTKPPQYIENRLY